MKTKPKVRGAHYTIDFFGCNTEQLNSIDFWKDVLPKAAQNGNLDILYSYFHKFDPQGITGFLLLSSSHIAFHTWPEYEYVSCDVFSCSSGDDTKKAVDVLKKSIIHKRAETHYIKRGYVVMDYFQSPIYSTGKIEHIKVIRKVADIKSPFQDILVIDTAKYGRCMSIDGLIQTSESDHEVYDRAILKKLSSSDKKILILGGGDGYVAETALKINPGLNITLIDLDSEVIDCSKKYLKQRVFSDNRVTLKIGDASHYLEQTANIEKVKFDGIVVDLTDNPIGTKEDKERLKDFYSKIISLSRRLLVEGGWIGIQAGASEVVPAYINSAKIITPILKSNFAHIEIDQVMIPSFSEKNTFLYSELKSQE